VVNHLFQYSHAPMPPICLPFPDLALAVSPSRESQNDRRDPSEAQIDECLYQNRYQN